MMVTLKPAPVTQVNLPIAREQIVEMIVVMRTPTGVEVAGDLSNGDVCKNLLLDGLTRLHALMGPARVPND